MAFKRLISEKEFRETVLRKSSTSYWRLKKSGDVPDSLRIGGRIYYTEQAIDEWILQKSTKSGAGKLPVAA